MGQNRIREYQMKGRFHLKMLFANQQEGLMDEREANQIGFGYSLVVFRAMVSVVSEDGNSYGSYKESSKKNPETRCCFDI